MKSWKSHHRNRQRALRRKTIRIEPRYFMRNPDITWDAWKEWLDKLLPTMLNENSVMARILMRKPEPTPTRRTQLPRRFESYQGFTDGLTVKDNAVLLITMPPPRSRFFIVADDIDFSKPPPEPRPTKEFIYGDNWVAYRRV